MGNFKKDDLVNTLPAKQLLKDVWFNLVSLSEGGRSVLEAWVPRLGSDWKPTGQHTSVQTEIGALPQNFANLSGKLDAVLEAVGQVAANGGHELDLAKVEQAGYNGTMRALREGTAAMAAAVTEAGA